jgi:polysaccharide biosynthesis/export protein
MIRRIIYILIFILITIGCTRYKDITYLRNAGIPQTDTLYKSISTVYKVQPSDILYIKVNSLDESINSIFNPNIPSSGTSSSTGTSNYYITGYPIDIDGNITLPIMGKISVTGYTTEEIQALIQKQAEKFIMDARIDVRLVSFKISVLGEVKNPGQYTIFNDKANIFEALAMASDLTYFGNRHKILLLRSGTKGTETYRIDLTDKNTLSSAFFYLQPHDIIYVEPMKSTSIRLSASEYSVLLTTITATLSLVFLIYKIY